MAFVACHDSSSSNELTTTRFSRPDEVAPAAGTWQTFVVADVKELRPAPPQLVRGDLDEVQQIAASRTPDQEAKILAWAGGAAKRWNELERALISKLKTNPPRASRALALVSVAMNDAMVACWDAKYAYRCERPSRFAGGPTTYGPQQKTPSYPSERATIGMAAAAVLKDLFPSEVAAIDALLAESREVDLASGAHYRSDVTVGENLGAAVAARVLDRAHADNSGAAYAGTPKTGPGFWEPTPPALVQSPLEPACGQWKTWVLENGQAVRPPAPPAYGSPEFLAQLKEVWDVNQGLTPERLAIAQFWADGAGTQTPPGHWNEIALQKAAQFQKSEPETARILAVLGIAQADAFIACWDSKYEFWCVRPITEIRKVYDPAWLSPIGTPPFPSYPSGHSTTSGAASTVLSHFFPDAARELVAMGMEAMTSRLYGGIHFTFDNYTGMQMGVAIGEKTIAMLRE